jgi:hypothetical protein
MTLTISDQELFDQARPLFQKGMKIAAVSVALNIPWGEVRKLREHFYAEGWKGEDLPPAHEPKAEDVVFEPSAEDEETAAEVWDVTIQVPEGQIDTLLQTLTHEDAVACLVGLDTATKFTIWAGLMQRRINAILAPEVADGN